MRALHLFNYYHIPCQVLQSMSLTGGAGVGGIRVIKPCFAAKAIASIRDSSASPTLFGDGLSNCSIGHSCGIGNLFLCNYDSLYIYI